MTDLEYLDAAEALLKAIEQHVDHINEATDADLDAQRVGGMITLVFANRTQIIINLQKPLHEVWMASKTGGYHYQLKPTDSGIKWLENRSGSEFLADLSRDASAQAGEMLVFG
jgi:CyaY protein